VIVDDVDDEGEGEQGGQTNQDITIEKPKTGASRLAEMIHTEKKKIERASM